MQGKGCLFTSDWFLNGSPPAVIICHDVYRQAVKTDKTNKVELGIWKVYIVKHCFFSDFFLFAFAWSHRPFNFSSIVTIGNVVTCIVVLHNG